jgi:hypothetical protein
MLPCRFLQIVADSRHRGKASEIGFLPMDKILVFPGFFEGFHNFITQIMSIKL